MFLSFFFSGVGRKLAIYGGVAIAVLLIVCGIYGAGGKAADAAAVRRTLDRTLKNLKTKGEVLNEIADSARSGITSASRLRDEFSRD